MERNGLRREIGSVCKMCINCKRKNCVAEERTDCFKMNENTCDYICEECKIDALKKCKCKVLPQKGDKNV